MKSLAVANQKGGVSKTTVCCHVAFAAVERGLRVLLVDLDKQGSLGLSFPGSSDGLKSSSLFGLEVNGKPEKINENLSIIRADESLALLDGFNDTLIRRPADHLRRYGDEFDICVIDTPGAIGMKLYAALSAADAVICPVSVGLYEAAGLAELWQFVRAIKTKGFNPRLKVLGMLPSRINTKSRMEMAGLAKLREKFGDAILPHTLGERAAVKQAISRRKPVWQGMKGTGHQSAGQEWRDACNDILTKMGAI